jgi:hypothetical protein
MSSLPSTAEVAAARWLAVLGLGVFVLSLFSLELTRLEAGVALVWLLPIAVLAAVMAQTSCPLLFLPLLPLLPLLPQAYVLVASGAWRPTPCPTVPSAAAANASCVPMSAPSRFSKPRASGALASGPDRIGVDPG